MNIESMGLYQKAKITAILETIINEPDADYDWDDPIYGAPEKIEGFYYDKSSNFKLYSAMFTTEIDGVFTTKNSLVLQDDYRLTIDGIYYTRKGVNNVALLNDAYVVGVKRIED